MKKHIFEADEKPSTVSTKTDDKAKTQVPAAPAEKEPKKKELDKTIPQRNMGDIYKTIEPFIRRYAANSYRYPQQINPGILQLIFGGSYAKLEVNVLYELLTTKFNDDFTVQKTRFDSDSKTITLTIF